MHDLQAALDKRLAALRKARNSSVHGEKVDGVDVSKEGITRSLQGAGILDKKGEVVRRVSAA